MEINQIKAVYQELQGYLSQLPPTKGSYDSIDFVPIGTQINSAIDELNTITEKNYDKFKIKGEGNYDSQYVYITTVRTNLGGLIDRLHAEYFEQENRPFGGSPQTVISNNQSQNQTLNLTLFLEIQSKIINKLQDPNLEANEKGFLEKIKEALPTTNDALGLFSLILTTANQLGISVEKIKQLFGF
jgi:hypothetical protein